MDNLDYETAFLKRHGYLPEEAMERIEKLERALHDCYDAVSWTGQGRIVGEIISRALGLPNKAR